MRSAVVGLCLAAAVFTDSRLGASPADDASALLARARQALGGDARLSAVRSFMLKGTTRNFSHLSHGEPVGQVIYGTFEIDCVLPDRFVQIDTRGASFADDSVYGQVSGGFTRLDERTVLGFNAAALVYESSAPYTPWTLTVAADQRRAIDQAHVRALATEARRGFASLALAMFAQSFPGAPLVFRDTGDPQVLNADGVDFSTEIRFNPVTHLPAAVGALTYADYRDVEGVRIPFHMTARTRMWDVTSVRLNPQIDDKKFRPIVAAGRHSER